MTTQPLPPLVDRQDAYRTGRTRYYTGKPCKQGHIAERYVSTGGCTACHNPFVQRKHPFRKDLAPYVCPKLWIQGNTTVEEFAALEPYLQTCIDTFFKHQRSEK